MMNIVEISVFHPLYNFDKSIFYSISGMNVSTVFTSTKGLVVSVMYVYNNC